MNREKLYLLEIVLFLFGVLLISFFLIFYLEDIRYFFSFYILIFFVIVVFFIKLYLNIQHNLDNKSLKIKEFIDKEFKQKIVLGIKNQVQANHIDYLVDLKQKMIFLEKQIKRLKDTHQLYIQENRMSIRDDKDLLNKITLILEEVLDSQEMQSRFIEKKFNEFSINNKPRKK